MQPGNSPDDAFWDKMPYSVIPVVNRTTKKQTKKTPPSAQDNSRDYENGFAGFGRLILCSRLFMGHESGPAETVFKA